MLRYTIKELKEISHKQLILALINERKERLTNNYSPLNKRLSDLYKWVENEIPSPQG